MPTAARDACALASELAAWTVEHLCIGTTCCLASQESRMIADAKAIAIRAIRME